MTRNTYSITIGVDPRKHLLLCVERGSMMAKIIHTSDEIRLSKIDMATLHAIAEREGLKEVPDYMIFAINPQLYDQAAKKADEKFLQYIAQLDKHRAS